MKNLLVIIPINLLIMLYVCIITIPFAFSAYIAIISWIITDIPFVEKVESFFFYIPNKLENLKPEERKW